MTTALYNRLGPDEGGEVIAFFDSLLADIVAN